MNRRTDTLEHIELIDSKSYINSETNEIIKRSETIGNILRYLRKRQKITQTDISKQIGIAQQTYAGYENGKHEPSIEIIIRLADFYDVSMDYITGRFIGSDGERARIEEFEMEEYLAAAIENNRIQMQSEKQFQKMIRLNIKSKK